MADSNRRLRCPRCEERFDPDRTFGTFDGDRATYRCPYCGWWTPGPPPV